MPDLPLFHSHVRPVGVPLLQGRMTLYPDRLCLEGRRRSLRPYRRTVPLEQIQQVDWTTLDEPYNLTLVLADEVLYLAVPEPATWKFAIEAAFPNVGRAPVGLPCLATDVRERLRGESRLPAAQRPKERQERGVASTRAAPPPDVHDLLRALEGARITSVQMPREGEMVLALRLAERRPDATLAEGLLALRSPIFAEPPRA